MGRNRAQEKTAKEDGDKRQARLKELHRKRWLTRTVLLIIGGMVFIKYAGIIHTAANAHLCRPDGQQNAPDRFEPETFTAGFQLLLWGYFKKMVVADRLAYVTNIVAILLEGCCGSDFDAPAFLYMQFSR